MKTIVGKEAEVKARLYLLVRFKCSKCECENLMSSFLDIEGNASGDRWASTDYLSQQATNNFLADTQRIQTEIDNHNYKNLRLKCRCKDCGAKPIWTKFFSVRYFLRGFRDRISFFLTLLLLLYIYLSFENPIITFPVVIMMLFILVNNLIVKFKTSKLAEEYLPNIEVKFYGK